MRRVVTTALLALVLLQPACIWKLWSRGGKTSEEEREFDIYGTVETIDADALTIRTRGGTQTFLFGPASVKGGELEPGQTVHVFYKREDSGSVITLVVRKID